MDRRMLLSSVFYGTGVGLAAARSAAAAAVQPRESSGQPRRRFEPFVETRDGVCLYYREWGSGEPVVFVHSWAVNADLWQYQMVHLSDRGMRCIAYDQRGHGRSSDPGAGFDYDTLSDDLAAVMERARARGATLVGHSMGCGVIARYLTRHGSDRVARAALVSPTLPFLVKTPDNPEGIDRSALDRLRGLWSTDFPGWLADNARPFFVAGTSAATVDWGIGLCWQASLRALIDCNRADFETDFRGELPRLRLPILIVHGDRDVSAPLDLTGRKTAQLIPGSRLRVYEGAPHGVMFTHTDRLNAELLSFIGVGKSGSVSDRTPTASSLSDTPENRLPGLRASAHTRRSP